MKSAYLLAGAVTLAALLTANAALAGNVASVNGVAITEAQVERALGQAGLPDQAEARAAVKSQLIARELLRQEASRKKYLTRPEAARGANLAAKQAADEAREATALRLYLRDAVKPEPVTDAQVKARFDAIVTSLGEQEYKTRLIAVADEARAQALLDQLKSGADFAALARQYSKLPSAARGGELDWVSFKLPATEGATQGYPLPLAEAIARLPAGAVNPMPIAYRGQFYLVRVDARRPTVVPDYGQIKPTLKAMLEQQSLERATAVLVATLVRNARIQP